MRFLFEHIRLRVGNVLLYPRSLLIFSLCFSAAPLLAHPMGNFSVNHYSGIVVTSESLQLRYLIDMAEIPTFQEMQDTGIKADPKGPRILAYLKRKSDEFLRGITLTVDGKRIELVRADAQVIFPSGAGGLPTMKLGINYRASLNKLSRGAHRIEFRDDNFPGRAGWKEVIINADSSLQLVSDAPRVDRSAELSNYPTDLLNSPPQDLSAHASFNIPAIASQSVKSQPKLASSFQPRRYSPSPASITVVPNKEQHTTHAANPASHTLSENAQATPRNLFTQLVAAQNLSWWFLLTAASIAAGFGALHALEPGHGKTLVAAYLVGSRGTAWHAVLLGIVVTLAHTAGVYALGAITLYASRYILPEKLYPWLGALSGLTIVGLGVLLFMRRWAGEDSSLDGDHRHWYDRAGPIPQSSGFGAVAARAKQPVSLRQLVVLGITGGLVPCPAALVVLLSAIALHRIAFGFFLIVCFSLGLAAVLIAIGLLMVHAGRFVTSLNPSSSLVRRHLPLISAGFITVVGGALVLQSIKGAGISVHFAAFASPKWLLVAGVGLLLGMRHSTDSDHVVAVTTIVTRLGSLRDASLVGMLWGVGHTLTIFIVGSAIILFGIVIPPRLGLSMEFAVALMLIALGILNLTGALKWISNRFTPSPQMHSGVQGTGGPPESLLGRALSRFGTYNLLRPLVIGIIHGLAGSAAIALLVLATIHDPIWAIGYLLLFGLGTIAGMMMMTAVIAMPVVWTGKNFSQWNGYISATSGIVSLAFGIFLIYQIGFVSGLFSSVPKWIPQ